MGLSEKKLREPCVEPARRRVQGDNVTRTIVAFNFFSVSASLHHFSGRGGLSRRCKTTTAGPLPEAVDKTTQ
uniref:Uncharacterized protein n=1 Tax=Heterorhabditis bacteriophora TaxID=37862 RepID=A0A1I7XSM7_HETBA